VKVIRTRAGARLVEAGTVVSEILREPGPSHTLFDVLAAAVAALSPGPRVLLLGFAGGGTVPPLRAMGFEGAIEAVDLSTEGAKLFREVAGGRAGEVRIHRAEASAWLRADRRLWDLIVEDLFLDGPRGMAKPEVSRTSLPRLLARRLATSGVAVVNLLPERGRTWRDLTGPLAEPHLVRRVVTLADYENKLLLAGSALPGAREISSRLRAALRAIGSKQAERISVANA